jgi:hypothetical protein
MLSTDTEIYDVVALKLSAKKKHPMSRRACAI